MNRSVFVRVAVAFSVAIVSLSLMGCLGKEAIFAGRTQPPSLFYQRVLVAIQNPSPLTTGSLQIIDGRYDIRNSENGRNPSFFISGYTGKLPSSILNYPEQEIGFVYGYGDGSLASLNYVKESQAGSVGGLTPGLSDSAFYVTQDGLYAFGAAQSSQFLTVVDNHAGVTVALNLPNVYRVAVNPSGSVALAFVQNSDYAYRVIHLQQPNGTVAPVPTFPNEANWPKLVSPVDCQPINVPVYCVVPVLDQTGNPIKFDRPYKGIYSSDGTTAWIMNCGPECGNSAPDPVTNQATASVSFLGTGVLSVYNFPGSTYPTPPPQTQTQPTETARISVPGGATMALYGNGVLYISGQQLQKDGLFEGFLSLLNLSSMKVTNTYPIADGTHSKMLFGDDNTLWIGSHLCQIGERTATNQVNGCLTLFNMNNNTVLVEPWYGDLTGLCSITLWHKMYTAYGGQIHIYATTNNGITTTTTNYKAGTELSNINATVTGTAYDVAYMDAISNAAD